MRQSTVPDTEILLLDTTVNTKLPWRKRKESILAVCLISLLLLISSNYLLHKSRAVSRVSDLSFKRLEREAEFVVGNSGLQCLAISPNGEPLYLDGSSGINTYEVRYKNKPINAKAGALDRFGVAYIFDDRNILYKYSPLAGLKRFGSIPASCRILRMIADEHSHALWCAVTHWNPSSANLTLILLDVVTGHEIARYEPGFPGGSAFLLAQRGGRILMWSAAGSHVYLFNIEDGKLSVNVVTAEEDIQQATFDDHDVFIGLESGAIKRVALDSSMNKVITYAEATSMEGIAVWGDDILIAHGGGNALFGHGSLEVINKLSGESVDTCDSPESMVTIIGPPSESSVLYATEVGSLHQYLASNECRDIDVGGNYLNSNILYIGRVSGRYMILSKNTVVAFQLPSRSGD